MIYSSAPSAGGSSRASARQQDVWDGDGAGVPSPWADARGRGSSSAGEVVPVPYAAINYTVVRRFIEDVLQSARLAEREHFRAWLPLCTQTNAIQNKLAGVPFRAQGLGSGGPPASGPDKETIRYRRHNGFGDSSMVRGISAAAPSVHRPAPPPVPAAPAAPCRPALTSDVHDLNIDGSINYDAADYHPDKKATQLTGGPDAHPHGTSRSMAEEQHSAARPATCYAEFKDTQQLYYALIAHINQLLCGVYQSFYHYRPFLAALHDTTRAADNDDNDVSQLEPLCTREETLFTGPPPHACLATLATCCRQRALVLARHLAASVAPRTCKTAASASNAPSESGRGATTLLEATEASDLACDSGNGTQTDNKTKNDPVTQNELNLFLAECDAVSSGLADNEELLKLSLKDRAQLKEPAKLPSLQKTSAADGLGSREGYNIVDPRSPASDAVGGPSREDARNVGQFIVILALQCLALLDSAYHAWLGCLKENAGMLVCQEGEGTQVPRDSRRQAGSKQETNKARGHEGARPQKPCDKSLLSRPYDHLLELLLPSLPMSWGLISAASRTIHAAPPTATASPRVAQPDDMCPRPPGLPDLPLSLLLQQRDHRYITSHGPMVLTCRSRHKASPRDSCPSSIGDSDKARYETVIGGPCWYLEHREASNSRQEAVKSPTPSHPTAETANAEREHQATLKTAGRRRPPLYKALFSLLTLPTAPRPDRARALAHVTGVSSSTQVRTRVIRPKTSSGDPPNADDYYHYFYHPTRGQAPMTAVVTITQTLTTGPLLVGTSRPIPLVDIRHHYHGDTIDYDHYHWVRAPVPPGSGSRSGRDCGYYNYNGTGTTSCQHVRISGRSAYECWREGLVAGTAPHHPNWPSCPGHSETVINKMLGVEDVGDATSQHDRYRRYNAGNFNAERELNDSKSLNRRRNSYKKFERFDEDAIREPGGDTVGAERGRATEGPRYDSLAKGQHDIPIPAARPRVLHKYQCKSIIKPLRSATMPASYSRLLSQSDNTRILVPPDVEAKRRVIFSTNAAPSTTVPIRYSNVIVDNERVGGASSSTPSRFSLPSSPALPGDSPPVRPLPPDGHAEGRNKLHDAARRRSSLYNYPGTLADPVTGRVRLPGVPEYSYQFAFSESGDRAKEESPGIVETLDGDDQASPNRLYHTIIHTDVVGTDPACQPRDNGVNHANAGLPVEGIVMKRDEDETVVRVRGSSERTDKEREKRSASICRGGSSRRISIGALATAAAAQVDWRPRESGSFNDFLEQYRSRDDHGGAAQDGEADNEQARPAHQGGAHQGGGKKTISIPTSTTIAFEEEEELLQKIDLPHGMKGEKNTEQDSVGQAGKGKSQPPVPAKRPGGAVSIPIAEVLHWTEPRGLF